MHMRRRAVLIPPILFALGGCSSLGGLAGGLTGGIGSILELAFTLALIAAPIYLSYWLYQRNNKD